jgi:hypothetical protein
MNLARLAVRASVLGAIAAAVALFFVLAIRRAPPPEPRQDPPAGATVR